ncbi:MAG: glycosyltransferase family 87 protein, partial [Anaerolineales bacterium]
MKEYQRYLDNKILQKIILILIVFFVSLINVLAFYRFSVIAPGGNDSIPRWIGTRAWLFEGINPYSSEVTARAQRMIYGRLATPQEDQQKFVYPFYTILFYIPVAWMKYEWARAIYMFILELAILALVLVSIKIMRWSPPKWLLISTILFGIFFYHSIRTIVLWQLAGICALLITISIWGILNKNDFVAGISLALASIKPQMVYLIIPLVFLSSIVFRRWKLSLSLLITLLILMGGSFLLLPTWLSDMLQQIVDYEKYTYTVSPIHILTHIIFPFMGDNIEKILIMVLLVWLIYEWFQLKGF